MDNNSLSHTSWNCKYHIVFAPKYRRRVIYGRIRVDIGKILRLLCDRKENSPLGLVEKDVRLVYFSTRLETLRVRPLIGAVQTAG